MNIASIDIGSNSIILLTASVDTTNRRIIPTGNYYRTPRIGKGLTAGSPMDNDAVSRLRTVMIEFAGIADSAGAGVILPCATQAFRMASNAVEVINYIKNETGLEIRVLTGAEEAYYSYLGAVSGRKSYSGCLIDIGGGSSEIISGESGEIRFSHSYSAGTIRICESQNTVPPLIGNRIPGLRDHIKEHFNTPPLPLDVKRAIAVAGAPTTLVCMNEGIKEFDEAVIDNYSLSREMINKLIAEMSIHAPAEILKMYGKIIEGREDVMLTGALILDVIMELLGLNEVTVTTKGLRNGIIYDYLGKSVKEFQNE